MNRYFLQWRGQRSGPYTIEEIEQKLTDNEIGLWHQVGDDGAGITVGDLLEQVNAQKREAQLQLEQTREREQGEARQRADYQHAQALQRLQEENEALADELENVKLSQQGNPSTPQSPFLPGYAQFPTPQPPPVAQRTSGQAITAFVFSLLNFVPGINFISWLIAIVLAHSALADIRRDPSLGGRGLALAALWITYSLIFLGIIIGILIAIGAHNAS